MQLLAHLGPEVITEISLEDEEDEDKEADEGQDGTPCSSGHCKKIITGDYGLYPRCTTLQASGTTGTILCIKQYCRYSFEHFNAS